jgi:apolipoprotein N-acyltransferase
MAVQRPRPKWYRRPELRPDWRTVLSAVLIVFAFPPWNVTPLAWICLAPWFAALERAPTAGAAALQGLWFSVFMSLGGFYWVAYVLQEFGQVPWAVAVLGLVLYSLIGQPQFTLFGPVRWKLERARIGMTAPWRSAGLALASALAYAGLDWCLPKLFVDTLGYAFHDSKWLRQAADLGGPPLLTVVGYVANDAIWTLYRRLRDRREPSTRPALAATAPQAAFALLAVSATAGYGYVRLGEIEAILAKPHPSVQLGVIQANIGDFDKIAAERGVRGAAEKVMQTFFTMTDQALAMTPRPQAVVWPETSYPSTFRTPETTDELARDQQLERFVRDRGVPLLFGGYDRAGGKDFNAFFFLDPRAGESDLQVYRKNVLLLFGEYIPGASFIKPLRDAFPQVGNFGRGAGPEVLRVGDVRAGPVICYEILFPDYVIAAARKGSQLILNITNDSWFGPWGEPELHLSLSAFRGIETRLPQLRSTNTGISALISPTGELTHTTRIGTPEIMNVSVPLVPPIPTLMLAWGDWFGKTAFGAGFGLLGLALLLSRRSPSRQGRERRQAADALPSA